MESLTVVTRKHSSDLSGNWREISRSRPNLFSASDRILSGLPSPATTFAICLIPSQWIAGGPVVTNYTKCSDVSSALLLRMGISVNRTSHATYSTVPGTVTATSTEKHMLWEHTIQTSAHGFPFCLSKLLLGGDLGYRDEGCMRLSHEPAQASTTT